MTTNAHRHRPWSRRQPVEVHSVTTASAGRSADLGRRQLQYFLAMLVRLVCFVLALVVPYGWITWVFVVGAMVLPYVAVLLANASGPGQGGGQITSPDHEVPRISEPVQYRISHRDTDGT